MFDFLKKKKDPFGDLGSDNFGQDNLGLDAPSRGMPDLTRFRGVGDPMGQQQMNQSINQQLGPDYMSPDSPDSFNQPPSFNQAKPPLFNERFNGQPQQFQSSHNESHTELEVINAKLDAIKATMDAINQRLANLERLAYGDQEQNKGW